MSVQAAGPVSQPPPPPPPPPPKKPDAGTRADQLIKDAQHEECAVSLPVVGDRLCRTETDGAKVGKEIAALSNSEPAYARAVFDKSMDKLSSTDDRKELAHGLTDGASHDELKAMAGTTQGRAMLDRAAAELTSGSQSDADKQTATRVDSAAKAADLAKDPAFKKLDPATQVQVQDQIERHATDAAAVDNVVALSKSTGFQSAAPATRKALLQAQDRHANDTIFREGLEKLAADPAFAKLSPTQRVDAVRAFESVAGAEAYQGKEGSWFFNLGSKTVGDAEKRQVLDNAQQLVTSKGYHDAAPGERAKVLDTFKRHAADTALTQGLVDLIGDSAFAALSSTQRADVLDGVSKLTDNKDFQSLSAADKTAVLAQVRNYPDAKVVNNLERLIGKDWFQDYDAGDKQRALKLIAYMSYPRTGVDQTIIDNTIEKFLSDDAPYRLALEPISAKPGNVTFGYAANDVMTINENLVAANNSKLETDSYGRKLSLDTIPHEISHLINDDKVAQTFDYLNEEYRSWYVGHSAENGKPPTNQEALARWSYFLDPGSGYYDSSAKGALADKDEAAKIFGQLSQLTGLKVDASNYQQVLQDLAADSSKFKTDPNAPAVVPPGNLDNH